MSTKTTLKIGLGVFAAAVMIGASQQMRSPVSAASQDVSPDRARVTTDAIALQAFGEPADDTAIVDAQSSFVALRVAHLGTQASEADRRVEQAWSDAMFALPARLAVADTERVATAVRAADIRRDQERAEVAKIEAARAAEEQQLADERAAQAALELAGRTPFGQGGNRFMCG